MRRCKCGFLIDADIDSDTCPSCGNPTSGRFLEEGCGCQEGIDICECEENDDCYKEDIIEDEDDDDDDDLEDDDEDTDWHPSTMDDPDED